MIDFIFAVLAATYLKVDLERDLNSNGALYNSKKSLKYLLKFIFDKNC